jgi:hypothetical protein
VRPLPDRQFNRLQASLLARLDRLGRTETIDRGSRRGLRTVRITVHVPGQVGEPRLPDEIRLDYEEWYRRTRIGWVRIRYNYNYFDLVHDGRWGMHLHPLPGSGGADVPHLVCIAPDGSGSGRHFASHEVDLLAAHDAFERHYADGRAIVCDGFDPID